MGNSKTIHPVAVPAMDHILRMLSILPDQCTDDVILDKQYGKSSGRSDSGRAGSNTSSDASAGCRAQFH